MQFFQFPPSTTSCPHVGKKAASITVNSAVGRVAISERYAIVSSRVTIDPAVGDSRMAYSSIIGSKIVAADAILNQHIIHIRILIPDWAAAVISSTAGALDDTSTYPAFSGNDIDCSTALVIGNLSILNCNTNDAYICQEIG